MYWSELLGKLDSVRSDIRQIPNFSRTLITPDHEILRNLVILSTAASVVEENRTITLDIGPDGKPIVPEGLQDLFAIAPIEGGRDELSSSQRIDTKTDVMKKAPKENEPRTSMLPRENKHVNRPPVLTEADGRSVEK